jgi:prephenate dehydrogenase
LVAIEIAGEGMVMEVKNAKIAIVGLGLMGGSLALALRGKCAYLLGIENDPKVLNLALELNVVDVASSDPAEVLSQADVIILAIPVKAIIAFLDKINEMNPHPAVILDLGSTKEKIIASMASLPARFDPIGGHPMCGKETHTLKNATGLLYQGAPFALTPLPRTTSRAKQIAQEITEIIGAEAIWVDSGTHDQWVSETSHLPYLLANALASSTSKEAARLTGPGFRSSTRLAVKPRSMMIDILQTNRENILSAIDMFQRKLEDLKYSLQIEDYPHLASQLSQGATHYEAIMEKHEKEREG